MKRFISLNLTLILLVTTMIIPLTARAEESGMCGNNVTWTLDDAGTLIIGGTGDMKLYINPADIPWNPVCSYINSVVIEDGVTSISDAVFSSCVNLTNVTIPASVTGIGLETFSGCDKLVAINVDANNEEYLSDNGIVYSKDMKHLWVYPAGKSESVFQIPNDVTSVEFAAFSRNKNITKVIMPEGFALIGNYSFLGCINLKTVVIPKEVYRIGSGAFSECSSLTDVYYTGNEQEWNADYNGENSGGTAIDIDNEYLTNANVHYNYVIGNEQLSTDTNTVNKNDIIVMLNDTKIDFDVQPQIINNRTMVPMRAIFETLGASVEWNGETRTVTSQKDDKVIILTIGDTKMYVNNEAVTLDSPACIIGGRTLVPVRAIAESFDLDVSWDGLTRTVLIGSVSDR